MSDHSPESKTNPGPGSQSPDARRPLKTRSTQWAHFSARLLLRLGLTPNAVSVGSIGFAGLAGLAFFLVSKWSVPSAGSMWGYWLLCILGIQGRLWCNLMDGMLAVEGGLKTPTGDLYNEVPDRLADSIILVSAGFAAGAWCPWGWHLAWGAALTAAITAYIRVLGASLTGKHDFRGPMAKPHRMALLTLACAIAWIEQSIGRVPWSLTFALGGIILLGSITCLRRLSVIADALRRRGS